MLKLLLATHGFLAAALIWGRLAVDGTLTHLQHALEHHDHILPGTKSALPTSFTGLRPVDQLLRSLIVLFWGAVDGSSPGNAAAGVYFAGQLFPLIAAMYLSGLRKGNGATLAATSMWFELIGIASIGLVGSLWGLTYTSASPLASQSISLDALRTESLVSRPGAAAFLLPAMAVCYVLPVILMGSSSTVVVQWSIVAWNLFPIFMIALAKGGESYLRSAPPSRRPVILPQEQQRSHMRVIRWVSATSVATGLFMHIAVVSLSVSTTLFPCLFKDISIQELRPSSLFHPPFLPTKTKSVSDGILGFILWDQVFGYSVVLFIFLIQLRKVLSLTNYSEYNSWLTLGVVSTILSVFVGPGTAIMVASWLRDELLYSLPVHCGGLSTKA